MPQVLEVQPTPNPHALKFILDQEIAPQSTSFRQPEEAQDHPLASKLFAIKGVKSVLLLGDFVTINKDPAAKWTPIRTKVRAILQSL